MMKSLHIDYLKLKDIIRSADDRRGDKMKYLLNKVILIYVLDIILEIWNLSVILQE